MTFVVVVVADFFPQSIGRTTLTKRKGMESNVDPASPAAPSLRQPPPTAAAAASDAEAQAQRHLDAGQEALNNLDFGVAAAQAAAALEVGGGREYDARWYERDRSFLFIICLLNAARLSLLYTPCERKEKKRKRREREEGRMIYPLRRKQCHHFFSFFPVVFPHSSRLLSSAL